MKSIENSKKKQRQPLELQANFKTDRNGKKKPKNPQDLQENDEKRRKLSRIKFESGKINKKQWKHACSLEGGTQIIKFAGNIGKTDGTT